MPNNVQKIIPIKIHKHQFNIYEMCIQNECFLHFIDPTIHHGHKKGMHKNNPQHDHIIIF